MASKSVHAGPCLRVPKANSCVKRSSDNALAVGSKVTAAHRAFVACQNAETLAHRGTSSEVPHPCGGILGACHDDVTRRVPADPLNFSRRAIKSRHKSTTISIPDANICIIASGCTKSTIGRKAAIYDGVGVATKLNEGRAVTSAPKVCSVITTAAQGAATIGTECYAVDGILVLCESKCGRIGRSRGLNAVLGSVHIAIAFGDNDLTFSSLGKIIVVIIIIIVLAARTLHEWLAVINLFKLAFVHLPGILTFGIVVLARGRRASGTLAIATHIHVLVHLGVVM
mmetsp:Transcript_1135/g.2723  ORF Transcript_1135/g.2723 Transcript_1135/m.2723 type:complete len:284 (-) Transcript_1135:385-1236(-)